MNAKEFCSLSLLSAGKLRCAILHEMAPDSQSPTTVMEVDQADLGTPCLSFKIFGSLL